MIARWEEYFRLYSKSEDHKKALARAEEIIKRELDEKSYVAFSGGKDSIALLFLCQTFKPDVSVFHWDHGSALMPREIENEIVKSIKIIAPGSQSYVHKFTFGEREQSRHDYYAWYKAFYGTLDGFKKQFGKTKAFIGLRAEESSKRSVTTKAGKQGEVYPIAHLSWRDVWGVIVSQNLPYPKVYDSYAELLGYDQARLVTFHDSEFDKFGSRNLDNILMWREKHSLNFTREKATSRDLARSDSQRTLSLAPHRNPASPILASWTLCRGSRSTSVSVSHLKS